MLILQTFPIDEQSCVLVYESFTHNFEEVRMHWTELAEPVAMMKEIKLPDYTLVNHSATQIKRVRIQIYCALCMFVSNSLTTFTRSCKPYLDYLSLDDPCQYLINNCRYYAVNKLGFWKLFLEASSTEMFGKSVNKL